MVYRQQSHQELQRHCLYILLQNVSSVMQVSMNHCIQHSHALLNSMATIEFPNIKTSEDMIFASPVLPRPRGQAQEQELQAPG